jgi:hypothetical protein
MFSFFKGKGAAKSPTVIHADVGAPLVRQQSFSAARPTAIPAQTPKQFALDGVPPDAALLEKPIPGQTTAAYVIEGAAGGARLAFVNIGGARAHIELWELTVKEKPLFGKKRAVRLDPEQDSWGAFLISDVALLPDNRVLLAVFYYAPQVKQALFLYDSTTDAYTKISNIVPYADNRQKFFEAQLVAPNAVIVEYYSDRIRLAPDVYYNTPSHLRLFAPRYPQGGEVLRLSADDGSVKRWTVINKTLWLEALDYREAHQPKTLIWSLNLENVLPR